MLAAMLHHPSHQVVFATYGFKFTCALTWVHTLFTLAGMRAFLAAGMFAHKPLPQRQLAPLAAAYVGYIVLCNLSLNINTVSRAGSRVCAPANARCSAAAAARQALARHRC